MDRAPLARAGRAVVVPLGATGHDAVRELRSARALLDRREWAAARTLYERWPTQAPPIERATALLAAGDTAAAAALAEAVTRAGVLPATRQVWLGE